MLISMKRNRKSVNFIPTEYEIPTWDTPLHLAARREHPRVVKIMIQAANKDTERGAVADTNDEKNTALHEAVRI